MPLSIFAAIKEKINIPKVVFSQKTRKGGKRNRKILLGTAKTNDTIWKMVDYSKTTSLYKIKEQTKKLLAKESTRLRRTWVGVSACACLRLTPGTVLNSDDKRKETFRGKKPAQKLGSRQLKS